MLRGQHIVVEHNRDRPTRCLYGLHKNGIYPLRTYRKFLAVFDCSRVEAILGDPGADSGGEGKSKQEGKYDTKEK